MKEDIKEKKHEINSSTLNECMCLLFVHIISQHEINSSTLNECMCLLFVHIISQICNKRSPPSSWKSVFATEWGTLLYKERNIKVNN